MKKGLLFVLITIFSLSSCYTRRSTNLLQERKSLPQYEKANYEEYKLQINDELLIRVLTTNEALKKMFPEVNTNNNIGGNSHRIYEDGTADFPYLPKVYLQGKTIKEAESILKEKLKDFSEDVEVKLALQTQNFCVIGEAGRGYFPIYKDRMTIFQALALSGGINDGAVFSKIRIIRTTDEGTIIKSFDIRTKSIIDSEFYYIQPNDIIYVDTSKKKFWGSSNLTSFLGLITSSVTFLLTVISLSK